MADVTELQLKVRNRGAATARQAGLIMRDGLRRATPRSQLTSVHTADRWTVDHRATSPTRFLEVLTNTSPVAGWLDKGTRPHVIRPRRVRALRFYAPEFRGATADGFVFARKVNHPGTAARNYIATVLNTDAWRFALRRGLREVR